MCNPKTKAACAISDVLSNSGTIRDIDFSVSENGKRTSYRNWCIRLVKEIKESMKNWESSYTNKEFAAFCRIYVFYRLEGSRDMFLCLGRWSAIGVGLRDDKLELRSVERPFNPDLQMNTKTEEHHISTIASFDSSKHDASKRKKLCQDNISGFPCSKNSVIIYGKDAEELDLEDNYKETKEAIDSFHFNCSKNKGADSLSLYEKPSNSKKRYRISKKTAFEKGVN